MHYSKKEIITALRDLGLKEGSVVFSHANIGYLGIPAEGNQSIIAHTVVYDAFREVIGESGTLVVPTFTYSFCKNEYFDLLETPSTCGAWTEFIRLKEESKRSLDPIFSVAALGERAEYLTSNISNECFGEESFWARLLEADGIICNINLWVISTFIHFVEKSLKVPYRYDKLFSGELIKDGVKKKKTVTYFCQDQTNKETEIEVERFDHLALASGLAKKISVGRGFITSMRASDMFKFTEKTISEEPFFLIKAGSKNLKPTIYNKREYNVPFLKSNASMKEMIATLTPMKRDLISDGYDDALDALTSQINLKVLNYPTGTKCFTWTIPEKWKCVEGYIEDLKGNRIFSYKDNPLHVMSYSQSVDKVVSRKELIEHLHVHPILENAIPYQFSFYKRDWGFCSSKIMREKLLHDEYKVKIDAEFSSGNLKVGEVFIPGIVPEEIIICAHLDHPMQSNDGLSGVVVGLDIMRNLLHESGLYYSYRLLIVPETIGSLAWLSHNEALIPKIKGGFFLEMLGIDSSLYLQHSFKEDSIFDRCIKKSLIEHESDTVALPFMQVVTNDERQFNSPGIRIPMVSLSRVRMPAISLDPIYNEYHSDKDNEKICHEEYLVKSRNAILQCIKNLEYNVIPEALFKGEVFLTGIGIEFDFNKEPIKSQWLFDIMHAFDGKKSVLEIAEKTKSTITFVSEVVRKFESHGLVKIQGRSI